MVCRGVHKYDLKKTTVKTKMIDVDLCRDSTLMMISAEVVERIVTRFSQAVGGGRTTDGHSPNVMIMFSRLDDLPYSLTYGATLQALR